LKVDIAVPNLEVSGTLKYLAGIALGFTALGHDVRLLFTGEGPNRQLVDSILGSTPRQRYAGTASHTLSRWLETPVIRLFAEGTFASKQSVNALGSFLSAGRFRRLIAGSDLVIYANFWAYPPAHLLQDGGPLEVLLFHEGIEASFLPWALRRPLQAYVRAIARSVNLPMATAGPVARILRSQGVAATPIYPGFQMGLAEGPKQPLIVADSRWVKEREPLRFVRIAQQVPEARFVMVGRFPDPTLRDRVVHELAVARLGERVQIMGSLREEELLDLYAHAKCVIRWAASGTENGFTFSLVSAVSAGSIPLLSSGLGGAEHLSQEVSQDLVPRSDSDFARILRRLLTDERYYLEMREKVVAWRDRRSWATVAREILEALPHSGVCLR
jgi:glycosyltransferase involved in cell wall biosynthesis